MKLIYLAGLWLALSLAAAAQVGTNSGNSQEMQKPLTGRNAEVITSPDINSAITGTTGTVTGQPADVSSGTTATAGASSAASLTTADVSTRETMEKQRLAQLIGKVAPSNSSPQPSPPFIAHSSEGKAQNGRNLAEASLKDGLRPGPSTDNGPVWAKPQGPAERQNKPQ